MKKGRPLVIFLAFGFLSLFSSVGLVIADPVDGSGHHTPLVIQVAIVLGIMVLIAALFGWFALRHLHQNKRKG